MNDNTLNPSENETPPPRHDMINNAVTFLQHPHLREASPEKIKGFLLSKGLSENEISLAYERLASSQPIAPEPILINHVINNEITVWTRLKYIIHMIASLGGFTYTVYIIIKKLIIPWWFGDPKKPDVLAGINDTNKNILETVKCIQDDLSEVKTEVETLKDELQHNRNNQTTVQMQDLKNELNSVKGLLLSRKQFPAPLARPGIPAWQLQATENTNVKSSSDSKESEDDFQNRLHMNGEALKDEAVAKDGEESRTEDKNSSCELVTLSGKSDLHQELVNGNTLVKDVPIVGPSANKSESVNNGCEIIPPFEESGSH